MFQFVYKRRWALAYALRRCYDRAIKAEKGEKMYNTSCK